MENTSSANTSFGLNLFRTICASQPDSNAFISPLSISVALSMTQLGARGETADGMMKALCWEAGKEGVVHEENREYLAMVQKSKEEYILSLANRLYVEEGYALLPEFLQQTQKLYLAEAVPAQFKSNTEQARVSINSWVSEQTHNKIQDLLVPGVIDALTRMVLVNAIYFKGSWVKPFEHKSSCPRPFKVSKSETKNVPTMMEERSCCVWMDDGTEGFSALELPYKGGDLSMVILLPTEDFGLANVEKTLSLEKLSSLCSKLKSEKVKLFLPKFEMTCSYSMKDLLSQLGMSLAFDTNLADFSGMTKLKELVVSEVIHKAFVKVDEEGSEAAAATAVMMMKRCMMVMQEVPEFRIDHPFLFIIRDKRASNSVLFMGRVVDPTK